MWQGEFLDIQKRDDVDPRPIYIVAHRINKGDQIATALHAGANAIECDVTFYDSDDNWFVHHGGWVFDGREAIDDWLAAAAAAATGFGDRFALIMFDVKTCDADHQINLVGLHEKVRRILPTNLNAVFSVAQFQQSSCFNALARRLTAHDGLSVDGSENVRKVCDLFTRELQVENNWYGAGIMSWLPGGEFQEVIDRAGRARDSMCGIKKTFLWTLASRDSIEEALTDRHVDAICVNLETVSLAVRIAKQCERMATRADNAFSVFSPTKKL